MSANVILNLFMRLNLRQLLEDVVQQENILCYLVHLGLFIHSRQPFDEHTHVLS